MASGASWIADPLTTPGYEMSGAEGGWVSEQPNNLIRSYWMQVLPQLGYTGPLTVQQTTGAGTVDQETTDILSPQALAAIAEFQKQGYDIVRNPQRTDVGSKGITEYGLRLPSGELAGTWERKAGAWYEQMAPYLGLVLPGVLGIAGISASSIGASIAPTASSAVQSAIGGAIIGGAKELITSGGDAESALKGALTGGALGAAADLVQPYIKEATNALANLSGDEVAQLAEADVAAADVAGGVTDVDVGGAGNVGAATDLQALRAQAYDSAIAAGLSHQEAINFALQESDIFSAAGTSGELSGLSPTANANALAGNVATIVPPTNALINDPFVGLAENLPVAPSPVDFTPAPVAPSPGVATVDLTAGQAPYDPYTGLAENFPTTTPPIIPPVADTGAGLGAAGTAAGVAGAGAAAAGTGAAGAGTAGAATGAGGEMIDLGADPLYGGAYTGSSAAESALTGATAGTAAGAAAGLTGIPVVDDFLKYLGTPAGAAALGAFGSLASGYLTGQAAKDAAQIQAQSAQNALALQREQFEYQKGLLEPYRKAGESALGRLTGIMGLDGQPAQPQQLLEMDPGYAFRLGEGMKALERVQAARGNMLSGGAIKAGQRYAQDFASGEYGNAYNRLANIAGLGQTVGGQLGTAAQQFGQTAGETMSQSANALAAGRIGRTSGYMGGIGGAVGAYQNYQNQQQQNQLFGRFIDIYGRAVGAGG